MDTYQHAHCEACRVGAPQIHESELDAFLQATAWQLESDMDIRKLVQVFTFKNFVDALAFANAVGALAEQENHHPALLVEWGRVTVHWWTHKIRGLHKNDLICAAKTDALFAKV